MLVQIRLSLELRPAVWACERVVIDMGVDVRLERLSLGKDLPTFGILAARP